MNRRELLVACCTAGTTVSASSRVVAAEHTATKNDGPVIGPFAHLCGIHVAKHDPRIQLITQHYCINHQDHGSKQSVFQCLLFDSERPGAKLIGVEYIISDKQYQELTPAEKKYWHPHAYEILAGLLIMPGVPFTEEIQHLRNFLPSWGKTWHTWPDPATAVPIGDPLLMWSLTADGQIDRSLLQKRDSLFKVSGDELRERRCRELQYEVPQVPFPQTIDEAGRQWTQHGDDQPTRRPESGSAVSR